MPEALVQSLGDLIRQFPFIAVTLLVCWYFMRDLKRIQARELEAKSQEIERLLQEKKQEIDRLIDERRKYFQLFLKELRAMNDDDAGPIGPEKPKK